MSEPFYGANFSTRFVNQFRYFVLLGTQVSVLFIILMNGLLHVKELLITIIDLKRQGKMSKQHNLMLAALASSFEMVK